MDRERLKQVHQTDLTESRLNQDFVEWLRTKGPTWLLVILVAVCVFLFVVRFRQGRVVHEHQAWKAFNEADLPGSFEDIAREYEGVDQIAKLAQIAAADKILSCVQRGVTLSAATTPPANPGAAPPPIPDSDRLAADERERYLDRAAGLFRQVLEADDGSDGLTMHAVRAMNGLAAVSESQGNAAAAIEWYEKAAARAERLYPGLAAQARGRAATASRYTTMVEIPARADVQKLRPTPPPRGVFEIDPALQKLLSPPEETKAEAQ